MLDELPEGPFSIICSYYEHLPAFQRLTLQQLEAAPQEDDELDPDYEPGADSSSEDEEDEELEEDRWRRNTDEYGGFIFDKDRDGPALTNTCSRTTFGTSSSRSMLEPSHRITTL